MYRQVTSGLTQIIFIALTVLVCAMPLVAQQGSTSQQPRVTDRDRRRMDIEDRVFALEMLNREARKPDRQIPQMDPTYLQIRKDYEQLQVVNFSMTQKSGANFTLDYKQVGEAASEIKKLASRLKTNLILPEPGKDEQPLKMPVEITDEQLKSSLGMLDKLVQSFVNNEMFQHPEVVDLKLAAQARRDLESIIKVSDHLKKSAEKLNKKVL